MINDSVLLKACQERKNYYIIRTHINADIVSRETYKLLSALDDYFDKFSDIENADLDQLLTWCFTAKFIDLKAAEIALFKTLVESAKTANVGLITDIIAEYKKKDVFASLQDIILKNGSLEEAKQLCEFDKTNRLDCEVAFELDSVLETTDRSNGLKWRLDCLNKGFAPVIKGDFLVIAARPGAGKTSFLCSEVTFMAEQLPKEKYVLWFHNEGEPRSIVERIYQSTLGIDTGTLRQHSDRAKNKYNSKIQGKIKLFNVMRFTYREIESIIKAYDVGLIVIDMLDHIKGFKSYQNETSDVKYEKLYQWCRELATIYAPLMGTSQIPGGYDSKWPQMENLKGSTTSKQGAAHSILMIGTDHEPTDIRYLSAPKNKMNCQADYFKETCNFDKAKSRFV